VCEEVRGERERENKMKVKSTSNLNVPEATPNTYS